MLTVAELIKELKKHPPESYVGWQSYDNGEDEISGLVETVSSFVPEASFNPRYCKNVRVVLS